MFEVLIRTSFVRDYPELNYSDSIVLTLSIDREYADTIKWIAGDVYLDKSLVHCLVSASRNNTIIKDLFDIKFNITAIITISVGKGLISGRLLYWDSSLIGVESYILKSVSS